MTPQTVKRGYARKDNRRPTTNRRQQRARTLERRAQRSAKRGQ